MQLLYGDVRRTYWCEIGLFEDVLLKVVIVRVML